MISILYFQIDSYPMHQPDITILFGKYMPLHGVSTTLAAITHDPREADGHSWGGGRGVFVLAGRGRVGKALNRFWLQLKTLIVAGRDADIIQVRNDSVFGLLALVFSRVIEKPFIFWMSFPYPENDVLRAREQGLTLGVFRWSYTWLRGHVTGFVQYRLVMPLATHLVVQSNRMKDDLIAKGMQADKMTVVPMGVDLDLVDAATLPCPTDEWLKGGKVISYLGALDKIRKIDHLFEVLRFVRLTEKDARLLLIGDAKEPADWAWLERRAREIGVSEWVRKTGWVDRGAAWSFARQTVVNVCALPDHYIFLSMSPTKLVELMALGVPVVATCHPEHDEILKESGAILRSSYDAKDIAETVVQALENKNETDRMTAKGIDYIRANRSYALIAENLALLYKRVLTQGGVTHATS